jgi:hypothetical protein
MKQQLLKWLKTKLYGKVLAYNSVYYGDKAPNPKKGWLKKSALREGDLWFDTKNSNRPHSWTGNVWRRLGVD